MKASSLFVSISNLFLIKSDKKYRLIKMEKMAPIVAPNVETMKPVNGPKIIPERMENIAATGIESDMNKIKDNKKMNNDRE